MKKIMVFSVLVLAIAGSSFAQGFMGRGMGAAGVEWKQGTSVLSEYKKSTGTLVIGQKLETTFKADGVEYTLVLPRNAASLLDVKNGDTITFEGVVTTVKSADSKINPVFHPLKAVLNGKEITLDDGPGSGMMNGRGAMNGGRSGRGR